jgi:hypothetical protein
MLWDDWDDDGDGGRAGYSICGMISVGCVMDRTRELRVSEARRSDSGMILVGCVMDAESESYVFLRHADLIP